MGSKQGGSSSRKLLAGANALHAAKSLVEESRIFGPGLYNENKKVLLTQVDTVSEEKGRTMKTQLGDETTMAEWMTPATELHATRRRRTAPRVPALETTAGANCQRLRNHVWPWGDDKPSGKRALLLSHSIQLVFSGFQC